LNKALQHPDTVALLKAQGVEAVGGSAAAFAAFIRSESVKLGGIARAVGAKLD
jgi:tripartite-type tricarboxylate transporter receptor subunit TctC